MTFAPAVLTDDMAPGREAFRAETPATRAAWSDEWPSNYGPLPAGDDRPPVLGPKSERHERTRAAVDRLCRLMTSRP